MSMDDVISINFLHFFFSSFSTLHCIVLMSIPTPVFGHGRTFVTVQSPVSYPFLSYGVNSAWTKFNLEGYADIKIGEKDVSVEELSLKEIAVNVGDYLRAIKSKSDHKLYSKLMSFDLDTFGYEYTVKGKFQEDDEILRENIEVTTAITSGLKTVEGYKAAVLRAARVAVEAASIDVEKRLIHEIEFKRLVFDNLLPADYDTPFDVVRKGGEPYVRYFFTVDLYTVYFVPPDYLSIDLPLVNKSKLPVTSSPKEVVVPLIDGVLFGGSE